MRPRSGNRWSTRFGRWVGAQTVPVVVVRLHDAGFPVTKGAVYQWLAGRAVPSTEHARALLVESRGRLTLADLVEHRRTIAP